MRLIRSTLLGLSLVAATVVAARADDASRLALAHDVIVASHATDTMRALVPVMLNQLKPMLAKQGADQKTVDDLMGRFAAKIDPELDKFADLAAQVYAKEFTDEDLTNLATFYKSKTGQDMVAKQPEITKFMTALGMQWGQNMGREVLTEYEHDKMNKTQQP